MRVETLPQALVIGAGIAGLRAALALSDLDISVHLVEKAEKAGGQVVRWGNLFPNDKVGADLVRGLLEEVHRRENVTLYLSTELVEKEGRIGDFALKLRTGTGDTISLKVGAIIVATGFDPYAPAPGEFGFGLDGVLTLPEFKELLANHPGPLEYHGRPVRYHRVRLLCRFPRRIEGGRPAPLLLPLLLQRDLPYRHRRERARSGPSPVPPLP